MNSDFFQKYDIWAFIPEYMNGMGEVTRVLVSKGDDHILPITMRTFRANMCKYYSIDYESNRKKFGRLIGSVNCIPLPINNNKVFLQLKVRTPKFRGDSAMGYLDLNSIRSLKEKKDKKGTEITLKDGRIIEVLYNISTVSKHMKNAEFIREYYRRERGYITYPEALEKLYSNLDKPATKADIAILTREIMNLKSSLKVF